TGKYQEAEECFDRIMSKDPENTRAMIYKSASLINQEKFTEALSLISKILALEPRNGMAMLAQSIVLYRTGKIKESSEVLEKVFDIEPENPEVWNARGIIMRKLDRMKEEIFSYNRAIELDKFSPNACVNKAIWLMEINKYDAAKNLLDNVLSKRPDFSMAWRESGECQIKREHLRDALRCYEMALQYNPDDYESYNGKAEVMSKTGGNINEILWTLEHSLSINSRQGRIWNNFGVHLVKAGRYEQAYKAFKNAYEQEDLHDEFLYNLLLLSMETGKKEDAELYLKRFRDTENQLDVPQASKSEYLETSYRKTITPFLLIDFADYFKCEIKDLPILLPKTGEYLASRKKLIK
ncbi:MAG: tetratricopeptide repeat protein, partial [bacterium]|nr:tetratricopeptide repeat protein [bacterium]